MSEPSWQSRDRVLSHAALKKLIGYLGVTLPFVLLAGNWLTTRALPPGSISGYYYTDMRNVFVGGMCALGVCLLAYRGRDKNDGLITDVAGSSTILVALFPTKPPLNKHQHLTFQQDFVGNLHVVFAAIALTALGVMALRFARSRRQPSALIYRACAVTIFSCILLAILPRLLLSINAGSRLLLLLEVLAMLSSGVSWLVPVPVDGHLPPLTEMAMKPIPVSSDVGPLH